MKSTETVATKVAGVLGFIFGLVLVIVVALTPSWVVLSAASSAVRAMSQQCDSGPWFVDGVLGTTWFCPEEGDE